MQVGTIQHILLLAVVLLTASSSIHTTAQPAGPALASLFEDHPNLSQELEDLDSADRILLKQNAAGRFKRSFAKPTVTADKQVFTAGSSATEHLARQKGSDEVVGVSHEHSRGGTNDDLPLWKQARAAAENKEAGFKSGTPLQHRAGNEVPNWKKRRDRGKTDFKSAESSTSDSTGVQKYPTKTRAVKGSVADVGHSEESLVDGHGTGVPAWKTKDADSSNQLVGKEADIESNDAPDSKTTDIDSSDVPAWKKAHIESTDLPAWKKTDIKSTDATTWKKTDLESTNTPTWKKTDVASNDIPAWKRKQDETNNVRAWEGNASASEKSDDAAGGWKSATSSEDDAIDGVPTWKRGRTADSGSSENASKLELTAITTDVVAETVSESTTAAGRASRPAGISTGAVQMEPATDEASNSKSYSAVETMDTEAAAAHGSEQETAELSQPDDNSTTETKLFRSGDDITTETESEQEEGRGWMPQAAANTTDNAVDAEPGADEDMAWSTSETQGSLGGKSESSADRMKNEAYVEPGTDEPSTWKSRSDVHTTDDITDARFGTDLAADWTADDSVTATGEAQEASKADPVLEDKLDWTLGAGSDGPEDIHAASNSAIATTEPSPANPTQTWKSSLDAMKRAVEENIPDKPHIGVSSVGATHTPRPSYTLPTSTTQGTVEAATAGYTGVVGAEEQEPGAVMSTTHTLDDSNPVQPTIIAGSVAVETEPTADHPVDGLGATVPSITSTIVNDSAALVQPKGVSGWGGWEDDDGAGYPVHDVGATVDELGANIDTDAETAIDWAKLLNKPTTVAAPIEEVQNEIDAAPVLAETTDSGRANGWGGVGTSKTNSEEMRHTDILEETTNPEIGSAPATEQLVAADTVASMDSTPDEMMGADVGVDEVPGTADEAPPVEGTEDDRDSDHEDSSPADDSQQEVTSADEVGFIGANEDENASPDDRMGDTNDKSFYHEETAIHPPKEGMQSDETWSPKDEAQAQLANLRGGSNNQLEYVHVEDQEVDQVVASRQQETSASVLHPAYDVLPTPSDSDSGPAAWNSDVPKDDSNASAFLSSGMGIAFLLAVGFMLLLGVWKFASPDVVRELNRILPFLNLNSDMVPRRKMMSDRGADFGFREPLKQSTEQWADDDDWGSNWDDEDDFKR